MHEKSKGVGNSFELLPLEERIQQYREMADATFLKAKRAEDPQIQSRYFELATQWHALARELEAGNLEVELLLDQSAAELDHPGETAQ